MAYEYVKQSYDVNPRSLSAPSTIMVSLRPMSAGLTRRWRCQTSCEHSFGQTTCGLLGLSRMGTLPCVRVLLWSPRITTSYTKCDTSDELLQTGIFGWGGSLPIRGSGDAIHAASGLLRFSHACPVTRFGPIPAPGGSWSSASLPRPSDFGSSQRAPSEKADLRRLGAGATRSGFANG